MIFSGYKCDKCGKERLYYGNMDEMMESKTRLIWHARKNGWSVGKKILCPECRKKRKMS